MTALPRSASRRGRRSTVRPTRTAPAPSWTVGTRALAPPWCRLRRPSTPGRSSRPRRSSTRSPRPAPRPASPRRARPSRTRSGSPSGNASSAVSPGTRIATASR
ncbi:hypothetical protein ADL26_11160 [Thermoactinomyces vulgaris]|nr:hypothetical protein ADL26_11160 [Thermoactinomyces vulgaris]